MKTNWPALGFSCLLLAGASVAGLPARAQVARETLVSAAAPLASISAVEVAQPGQQTTVRISGTGELHYRSSRLDSPPRLVLDFADTRLNVEKNKVPSDYAPVLDVRIGQPIPGQSRIVIDLAKLVPFSTQADGSNLTIFFAAPAAPATPAALRPAKKPAQRTMATVNTPNMPLPTWLTGRDMGFARPKAEPAAPEPQNPQAADSQTPSPTPEKKYTGDPISVNLKDVDLKDFFRLIHEISGLNVVLDPSVRGNVTPGPRRSSLGPGPGHRVAQQWAHQGNRRQCSTDRDAGHSQARSGPAPGTCQGAVRRGRTGDRDPGPELRAGRHDGGHAEKVPDASGRRFCRSSFEHPDHSGYSCLDTEGR